MKVQEKVSQLMHSHTHWVEGGVSDNYPLVGVAQCFVKILYCIQAFGNQNAGTAGSDQSAHHCGVDYKEMRSLT